jgi:hypothetical protein
MSQMMRILLATVLTCRVVIRAAHFDDVDIDRDGERVFLRQSRSFENAFPRAQHLRNDESPDRSSFPLTSTCRQ